ncbi:hypothetical protein PGT21_013882 [Puccinia graminis f. sp. tritici]|uniref:Uncharacterized protein n=1 Tax=Puccinia graminis f. sp. tritici TaxID=56615 RepID=A0A5B0PT60_PUCGR|nr:hypothetical protein PGT21_013882 [Puccinia graminis f. sp. tritici]KAA1104965.1 hypothetical protein PGTUg99_011447 [Puccinia graminis f. sp. tritici]
MQKFLKRKTSPYIETANLLNARDPQARPTSRNLTLKQQITNELLFINRPTPIENGEQLLAAGVPNPTKLMTKEERRNSTGGFLHTSSQTSLLLINKEALFNKSNFGKHQTAQQFIINNPNQQPERQNLKQKLTQRSNLKNNDDFDDLTTGFLSSITSNLSGLTNRQSLQTSSLPNYEDKPDSTASISTTIPSHKSSTHTSLLPLLNNPLFRLQRLPLRLRPPLKPPRLDPVIVI